MHMKSAKEIVLMLNENIDGVVKYLFPNGKQKGREWCVGSVSGEAGESLKICLEGSKKGVWSDFATGEKGDLLNLWCLNRNQSIREAILEINRWLGIPSPSFVPGKRSDWLKPDLKNSCALQLNSSVTNYLMNTRKLKMETLNKFQIREEQNQIVFPYYVDGKLKLIKYLQVERPNGKKQIRVSPNAEPCLFGWQDVPKDARRLVLVEGEIDAMTVAQYSLGLAVLSVPFGAGTGAKHQWLEYEFDRIAVFDEIYLCLDNDLAGQAATVELVERLGRHRCRLVQLQHKDANECLQKGMTREELQLCIQNAPTFDPDELKQAKHYVDQVIETFYPCADYFQGYTLPWQKSHHRIQFRSSELSIWTGINGHGKSQLLGYIMLHCMQQGAKVCMASLELKAKILLHKLTRQASGLRLPTQGYIRAIHDWYDGKLWIFDLVGTAKTKRLLEVFQYARQRYGVDTFVIDSFMKCGIGEEDLNAQKSFVEELCDFKNQHDCHIHLVVHPRKGADESKLIGKLDMKGSGAISDLADNCFIVWRNKKKEDQIHKLARQDPIPIALQEEVDCLLSCDKQRNGEWEGKIALWFNQDSFQYLEGNHHKAIQMVPYSNPLRNEKNGVTV